MNRTTITSAPSIIPNVPRFSYNRYMHHDHVLANGTFPAVHRQEAVFVNDFAFPLDAGSLLEQ